MILRRAGLLALLPAALALSAWAQTETGIGIRVIEGDEAINSIRLHRAHDPVVRVLDATGEPIAGAMVTFLLPASGPSGTFGDSGLSLTIQTDAKGMAVGRGLRPNRIAGQFHIRATTSWHSQAANASLTQTNAEPLAKSHTSRTLAIVIIAAAAVAGGAAAATHGKSSPAAASTGSTTITAGSPSFGPPQ